MLHKLVQSRQRHNCKINQRVHRNRFLFSKSMRKNFVICNKAASLHWNQRIETEMYVWTFPKSCFCNTKNSFDLTVEVQKITLHLNVACHKTSNSPRPLLSAGSESAVLTTGSPPRPQPPYPFASIGRGGRPRSSPREGLYCIDTI